MSAASTFRLPLRRQCVDTMTLFTWDKMKRATTSRVSRTDLKRLKAIKDADIVRNKDAPAWTPEMFARAVVRRRLKPVPKKSLLSLRIDADVVAWIRAQGSGYQSRMNALLREFMEAHR